MTKTLPLFTSSLVTRAWAIRRSLASLNRCRVMEISWRECLRRASSAMVLAAARRRRDEAEAARLAEIQAHDAGWRSYVDGCIAAGAGMGYAYARACHAA